MIATKAMLGSQWFPTADDAWEDLDKADTDSEVPSPPGLNDCTGGFLRMLRFKGVEWTNSSQWLGSGGALEVVSAYRLE